MVQPQNEEIKTWIFEQKIHTGYNQYDKSTWEFSGTEAQALAEFRNTIGKTWSPFITYSYWEKK